MLKPAGNAGCIRAFGSPSRTLPDPGCFASWGLKPTMSLRHRLGFEVKRAGPALIWIVVHFFLLSPLWPLPAGAVARFWIDARVHRKPARLWLDTGSEDFCLLRPAAERLGLKCRPAAHHGDGQQPYWATDPCLVSWNGFSTKTKVAIIEWPAFLQATGEDGI